MKPLKSKLEINGELYDGEFEFNAPTFQSPMQPSTAEASITFEFEPGAFDALRKHLGFPETFSIGEHEFTADFDVDWFMLDMSMSALESACGCEQ